MTQTQSIIREGTVASFLAELEMFARRAGREAFAFLTGDGEQLGSVQFNVLSASEIAIHRIWTLKPGQGSGSKILSRLCTLADGHGVEISLKIQPFGRKPYPMSREELRAWYSRHGFEDARKRMSRKPRGFNPETPL